MARAIALSPQQDSYDGENIVFVARVQFIGLDLPNGPDATMVTFVVVPSDTATTIRDKFANAIKAEATRLGYSLPNNSILLPAYVKV